MKGLFTVLFAACLASTFAQTKKTGVNKDAVVQSVDKHQQELIAISDKIWAYAETALKENKSSKELADYAEAQGFSVKRGVAGMPTAFIAEFGTGKPIIGIMGEFDALPGISQKAQPTREQEV
jgi:aminobenzoyl-glutamate utilization protein B